MTRRRLNKRSRQRAKFHKVQESLRKNARLRSFDSRNEGEGTSDASHPRQCSPESVLFELEHVDPLHNDKLSPEIIFKQPGTRSESLKDDLGIDDGIPARMIERSSPISSKDSEPDLPMCDFKCDTKCMNDFSNLEDSGERERDASKSIVGDLFDLTESYSFSLSSLSNETNNNANGTANVMHDRRSSPNTIDETARRNISESAICHPDLESQSRADVCTFANIPEPANSDAKRSPGVNSRQRKDCYLLETMDDCNLLDKTLSMNDNIMREINGYLDGQPSTIIVGKLGRDRVSEPPRMAILRETDERSELTGSTIRGSADGSRDKKKKRTSSNNKRFDVAIENIGERLTANWREFRKIFAYLRRASRRTRGEDAVECDESLHRYRKFPYVSVSTLSLPASMLRTPSSSPRRASRDEAREAERTRIPSESTTPRIGLMKRCRRTTLTFGDEDEKEAAGHRRPAIRADITDPLPEEKKEDKGHSFLLDPPSLYDKTRQNSRIPEPTIVSDIEVSDCNGRNDSPQKIEYHWDGTRKHQTPQKIATPRDSRSHISQGRNISRTIITWMITICIWLIKKLVHLVNFSYKKLRKFIIPPSSNSWTKKFDHLVETMHSENEMLYVMSEKMTRLSEDFVQIRTNTEATLNTLTAEVTVFREASKKMTEDNMALLQELKKLRETLEEVRMKSSQPVPLPSSCPLSSARSPLPPPLPQPPPPPPPPPPPLPPSLVFPLPPPLPLSLPPKMHTWESASSIPPPPPPLVSSIFLQSPIPLIQPTTPNSSRSKKNRTPTRKCSTPLFNRPSITVEDLLKVTLKKAPQSIKENRRNTVPGPKGPVVSLEMLRNVKLKSAKRRANDQTGRSPRNGRVIKSRTGASVNLSPILTGSEGNLERILRQVDLNRPRRLLSGSSSFRERDFAKETQYPSLETLTYSQSQSALE